MFSYRLKEIKLYYGGRPLPVALFSPTERNLPVDTTVEAVMRKVILTMHMSLDGFIAGPNGELDCTAADDADGQERYA